MPWLFSNGKEQYEIEKTFRRIELLFAVEKHLFLCKIKQYAKANSRK